MEASDSTSVRPDALSVAVRLMIDGQLRRRGIGDERVLDAMAKVPRHRFVPHLPPLRAYADEALPTASGQTISQPYIVALMSELLCVEPGQHVLEIGTGSGYQAAVLAHLGAMVVSVERLAELADQAQDTLAELGYGDRVIVRVGDGSLGSPGDAPFDRIVVTAAAPYVPEALGEQLVDGGRIVIPLGDRDEQRLTTLDRRGDQWVRTPGIGCRFVPLVGSDAWT